jgi:hypothetical protein
VAAGAGLLFLFLLAGWNPVFLGACWLLTLLSWAVGRFLRHTPHAGERSPE